MTHDETTGTTAHGTSSAIPVPVVAAAAASCCGPACCTPAAPAAAATDGDTVTEAVRSHYSAIAVEVLTTGQSSDCCASDCCGTPAGDVISQDLYAVDELDGLPLKAALASLGCGNPTALAALNGGETVLDLGSGGGIDVLLSARRVGPTGFAYGVDMTDPMLELARHNAEEAGVANVAFLKGDIAAIPLPDASVDVVISNCVINLASDKAPVLREAFRVLKPGGRFAVSDVVLHGGLPADLVGSTQLRRDLSSWTGCIAGALTDTEYRDGLAAAGFDEIDLEITRRYRLADLPDNLLGWTETLGTELVADLVGRFAGTFVRARKPV